MHRIRLLVFLGLATAAVAQTPINMPPFTSTYIAAATRGFYFVCPVSCVITGLEAPNEAGQPNQVLEVLDFGTSLPPNFPATAAPVSQLFYDNSVPAGTKANTNIALQPGRIYGIFGCCTEAQGSATTYTWYGNGSFTTDILGNPVVISRLVTQSGIASNGGNQPCSASTGPIGRVLVDIATGVGLYAGFTADVTTGASALTVNFTDTSFTSDPGGVTNWAWDFENDGTVDSTMQNPTHVFPCGDFDVSLTVTDGAHPADTEVKARFVQTDPLIASFDVTLLTPPNVWQFTDTSTLTPTSWAWDFENDGTVDSTLQNPTYTSATSCLDTTVRLNVVRNCRGVSITEPTFAAGSSFLGETGGGNALTSPTSVGNYFDIQVTAATGIKVCGLAVAPVALAGPFDVNVYLTEGSHLGKEGDADSWRLVGTGTGVSAGGGFAPPVLANVAMNPPFFLPAGDYGVAVFLSTPFGMAIAYTDGPAAAPYVGTDITIHPAGVGSSSNTELGPITFTPRLWNGGFYYSRCSVAGEAGTGFFGTGCAGTLGTPGLDPVGTVPALGSTYQLDVTNVPNGVVIMITGISHTFSPTFGPLPADGGACGAPGCWLRVDPGSNELLLTAGTTATWTYVVPNDPALSCLPIFNQAGVLSTGSNPLNFVMSDARAAVVGQ